MPDPFTGAVWMSRVSPRHRHASPNQPYRTPLRSKSTKRLLSAMRLPLGIPVTDRSLQGAGR